MQVGLYSPLNDEFQLLPGFEGTLQQVGGLQPLRRHAIWSGGGLQARRDLFGLHVMLSPD
jgi:hypothetical protein